MSEALAVYPAFNERVNVNKRQVVKEIKKKVENAKLELLKEGLDSNNIIYDKEIMDYHKLIDYLRKNLVTRDLSIANTLIEKINSSVDGMVSDLEKGSESAFTQFISKVESIIKPFGNTAINSLAASTLFTLAPTPLAKLGVGITLTGLSIYNMAKLDKHKVVTNKTFELNKILEELEITRDKDGNAIDTRFGPEIQRIIKDFLVTNNIHYDDTGYLSLREVIYNLDNDNKEKICHIINQLKGNVIDIDRRISDVNKNFFTRIKDKFVKPMTAGGASGVALATMINGVDPGLLSSVVNTGAIKFLFDKFVNSPVLSWISGLVSGGISLFGKYIPVVGPVIMKICAIENIGVLAIAGAGLGIFTALGKTIYNAIKNRKNNFQTQKDKKKLQELDFKLYGASDINEVKKIQETLKINNEKPEKIVINAVCEYMNELGINYPRRPSNYYELKEIINGLNKKDKNKVNCLLESLDEFLKRDPNNFRRCLKKTLNVVKTLACLGLASMSIVNLLTAGEFLDNIKASLFSKYGYTMPEKIPTFDDSVGIEEYNKLHPEPVTTNVEVNNYPNAQPLPSPAPATTPPPPMSTPAPSSSMMNQASSVTSFSTPTSNIPKFNIDDMVINGDSASWAELSKLSTEDLYKVVSNTADSNWASRVLEKLNTSDFLRLREYMETSSKLARNDRIYQFLKDGMEKVINNRNDLIQHEIDNILNRIATEENLTTAGLLVNGALTLANEEEKVKVR